MVDSTTNRPLRTSNEGTRQTLGAFGGGAQEGLLDAATSDDESILVPFLRRP